MKQWLSDNVTRAICWTLIHSLWQGLILAALAGLLVLSTRKQTAAFRYNVLAGLFLVFMGVAAITFVYQLNLPASSKELVQFAPQQAAQPGIDQLAIPGGTLVLQQEEQGYLARFTGYFNQHASLLVAIWFLVFLAKTVKLFSGLVYIQRIKHQKIQTPAEQWSNRLSELAAIVGVRLPVRLLESGLVKVPLVTGFLKPIILVPIGLMANLPVDQVEAILLHELAHIRRRDFLVNLVQSFAEIIFFFNPAVLWISALLREEREHCCDDMAIAVTQSKTGYITALVSFQEYQLEKETSYAMAFPGKKNQLFNRVKRIIDNSNKSLNRAEKSFLIFCISLIAILTMVFAQPAPVKVLAKETTHPSLLPITGNLNTTIDPGKDKHQESGIPVSNDISAEESGNGAAQYQPYQGQVPVAKDTMPVLVKGNSVMTGTITHDMDGKQYKVTINKNLATGLMIDGVKVPKGKLMEYRDVIGRIFQRMQADAGATNSVQIKEANNQAQLLAADQLKLQNNQLQLQGQLSAIQQENVSLKPMQTVLDPKNNYQLLKDPVALKVDSSARKPAMKDIVDEIIDDLKQAGIITQTNPLSYRINQHEFVVNNVQQPEALKRQFQEKYVKTKSDSYLFTRNGGHTSSTVVRER
jgi:beta-lactamase regulating signal transducer with metallopeptidase domain